MAETLVKKNATLNDTVDLIVKRIAIDQHSPFVKGLVDKLNTPGCPECFYAALHKWVYENIRYQLDPEGRERVLKPETTYMNREGDCKKMTVIIASALKAAGYEPYLKHVFFGTPPNYERYTHIYVVVPNQQLTGYVTIDPVDNPYFNREAPHSFANIYDSNGKPIMDLYTGRAPKQQYIAPMFNTGSNSILDDLSTISRTGQVTQQDQTMIDLLMQQEEGMQGIGRRRRSKEERKENRKKLGNKLKTVGLAPARLAFLGLVSINGLKMAKKLLMAYSKDQTRVKNFWEKLGGDWDKLKIAIERGSKQSVQGTTGSAAAAAAAIATATPVLIAAAQLFKDLKVSLGKEDEAETEDAMEDAEERAANDGKFDPRAVSNAVAAPDLIERDSQPPPRPAGAGFSIGLYSFDWNKKTDFALQVFDLIIKSGIYCTAASMIVKQLISLF